MHRLQQHILQRLILHPEQRYADLKPADIEGNLFMYHLRCVMKEGWVEKLPNGRYALSSAGKAYADRLSLKSYSPRIQPRIVTLIAVQDSDGRWLMYRRKRQPLINKIGFPYGKIHREERIHESATRELKEKTGLVADLQHVGDGYANTYEGEEPISQILFHMFYGTNPEGQLVETSEVGETLWLAEHELSSNEIMPNVPDLLRLVQQFNGQRFFVELNHHI